MIKAKTLKSFNLSTLEEFIEEYLKTQSVTAGEIISTCMSQVGNVYTVLILHK